MCVPIAKPNGQEFPYKGQLLLDYRATLLVLNLAFNFTFRDCRKIVKLKTHK